MIVGKTFSTVPKFKEIPVLKLNHLKELYSNFDICQPH